MYGILHKLVPYLDPKHGLYIWIHSPWFHSSTVGWANNRTNLSLLICIGHFVSVYILIYHSNLFTKVFIKIQRFPFTKMHLKPSSTKWRPYCSCLNVLICWTRIYYHIVVTNFSKVFGSEGDMSPVRWHAIAWTNAGIPFFGPLSW